VLRTALPATSACTGTITTTWTIGGRGVSNLWGIWGPLPHGVSRTDFLFGPEV
jgi:hypothetical protein